MINDCRFVYPGSFLGFGADRAIINTFRTAEKVRSFRFWSNSTLLSNDPPPGHNFGKLDIHVHGGCLSVIFLSEKFTFDSGCLYFPVDKTVNVCV